MLFRQTTHKTGNNAVEMSQAFYDIARFERFTDLNLRVCIRCHSKLGNGCFTILFDAAYFLLAVMVEGDRNSWLRMANKPAVLTGYWPLLTALMRICINIIIIIHVFLQFLTV